MAERTVLDMTIGSRGNAVCCCVVVRLIDDALVIGADRMYKRQGGDRHRRQQRKRGRESRRSRPSDRADHPFNDRVG